MQVIEIREPGTLEVTEEIVVGIDFGTTNSLIAISEDYDSRIIETRGGSKLVPSIIYIIDKQLTLDGSTNDKSIRSIKRLLAKSSLEIKNQPNLLGLASNLDLTGPLPKLKIGERSLSLPEVAAEIFKYLKQQAEISLNIKLKKAVVSVPAHFDDNAKGQVLLAARLAGIEVIRLIAEPTAAAYAYGLNKQQEGAYLVYDLGGGTFDVSILNMQTGILQVIATGGDNMLGGDDIDIIVAEYISGVVGGVVDEETIISAKEIKEKLSFGVPVKIVHDDIETDFPNEEFENLIEPLIRKTIQIAKDVLDDADNIDLDGIILVGGSSRIPMISRLLKDTFKVDIYSDQDPDMIVALGAALQAENLSSKPNSLLIDVVPLSVGLELYGGTAQKIIHRNTPIPFSVTQEFTTHSDNQTGMQFHIVQGEREMAKDCRSLAHFELKDIPPAKAGMGKVAVTFTIDADGILSVTACEAMTGTASTVEIKPSYGISEEETTGMLKAAYENAERDHKERLLAEAREQGSSIIMGVKQAICKTPGLLEEDEKIQIEQAITSLQKAIILDNQEDISVKIDALNSVATNFIQKHLNEGVGVHLKGRHINSI